MHVSAGKCISLKEDAQLCRPAIGSWYLNMIGHSLVVVGEIHGPLSGLLQREMCAHVGMLAWQAQ